jgi:molecular chaperone GrpE
MDDVDDVTVESEDGEGSTGTPEQRLKILREKLKKAQAEAGENLAGWQRSKADYVNLQKRSRDDLLLSADAAKARTLESFIPVFDSIEASAHEAVLKQLDSTLERLGVTRYRPDILSHFDPHTMEAVTTVATEDETQDNVVHSVLQSGYRSGDSIIRPARVTVYNHG